MATTPNVPNEQATKATLRSVTRGGSTPTTVNPPVDVAIMVNSLSTTSGVLLLSVPTNNTTFTISGSNGLTTATLTGTATGSQVSNLISALATTALSGQTFYVDAGPANYLYDTTTAIIVPSGATLSITNSTGTGTPTITAAALSGTEAQSYPNYVGTPNSAPTWVDDATVHAYQVGIGGAQNTQIIEQKQVRQILTGNGPDGGSQTEQYNGYFASYSGNLYQTVQKNTKRQQC